MDNTVPEILIQIDDTHSPFHCPFLPPIGTRIQAHKHLYDGGTYPQLEVIDHEWFIEDRDHPDQDPRVRILIKTKMLNG